MSQTVDALVIGGGPAGLAAGIALAQRRVRTLVCEAQTYPVDKPCGEGVMPSGRRDLERLGVLTHLPAADCFEFSGIRYISPNGQVLEGDFREGPGLGVRRTALSAAMLDCARRLDSLEVRSGCRAVPLARDASGVRVAVDGCEVIARVLIGADGLNSLLRKWAGLEHPLRSPSNRRWGARMHFCLPPWSRRVEVYWQRGIEAYITPVGAEQVGVAFLWDRQAYPQVQGGALLIPSLLAAFPELAARLHTAAPLSTPRAVGPLERRAHGPLADGVALVGDASGYIDAITGEGISLALAQAIALAEVAAPLLARAGRGLLLAADLQPYAHRHRQIGRAYRLFTRLALIFSRRPELLNGLIPLLRPFPGLFPLLLSANMGRSR